MDQGRGPLAQEVALTAPVWSNGPAPQRFTGLWRRLSIEFGDGSGEIETFVLWLQTAEIFIDLRLPAGPRAPDARGFADLTPADARILAAQEGFAGRLLWAEDRVAWSRALDFRPLGAPDEGLVARRGRVLVETGVHARYVEHWWQVPAEPVQLAAREEGGAWTAVAGDHVLFAEDRRPSSPEPGTLGPGVDAAAGDAAALAALLDCEISYGLRLPGGRWRITRSTLPWLEGRIRPLPPL